MRTNTCVFIRWTGQPPLPGLPPNGFSVMWNPLLNLPAVGETFSLYVSCDYLGMNAEADVRCDRVSSGVSYSPNGSEMMAVIWVSRA